MNFSAASASRASAIRSGVISASEPLYPPVQVLFAFRGADCRQFLERAPAVAVHDFYEERAAGLPLGKMSPVFDCGLQRLRPALCLFACAEALTLWRVSFNSYLRTVGDLAGELGFDAHKKALRAVTLRSACFIWRVCGPCRDRTYDQEIKSLLLYQLS